MKADKSLGQHFLVNQGIIDKICSVVKFYVPDPQLNWVVEIGPGPGAITHALLEKGLKVLAFDLDGRMIEHLKSKYSAEIAEGRFKLFLADALSFDFQEIIREHQVSVVCGNLPYNVGTEIVMKFYENYPEVENFCFMLQKEVVERFTGVQNTKAYSALGVRWIWGLNVEHKFLVKAGSFAPPPKVESAVFAYRRKHGEGVIAPHQEKDLYRRYSTILKQAFSQRRKMLRGLIPELLESPWASLRAEQVSPEDFVKICQLVEEARAKK